MVVLILKKNECVKKLFMSPLIFYCVKVTRVKKRLYTLQHHLLLLTPVVDIRAIFKYYLRRIDMSIVLIRPSTVYFEITPFLYRYLNQANEDL